MDSKIDLPLSFHFESARKWSLSTAHPQIHVLKVFFFFFVVESRPRFIKAKCQATPFYRNNLTRDPDTFKKKNLKYLFTSENIFSIKKKKLIENRAFQFNRI